MNTPAPTVASLPADAAVEWFSHSQRVVNGRPDARYGWADAADGACVVKCLDVKLGPSVAGLLDHERRVLLHLHERGAPVPQLVPCEEPAWLVTRFAGLSLRVLQQRPDSTRLFPFFARLAAWVHLLRRAESFVQAGALPLDIWAGNVVVPLSGRRSGQLVLQDVRTIDHAHTVVVGMNMRRPVWIDRRMPRVAPELKALLERDQEALTRLFHRRGAPMPQTTAAVRDEQGLSAALWLAYDAEQHLQVALDNGELDVAAAIQFAIGVAIEAGLAFAPCALHQPLRAVITRMTAAEPSRRHPSLADAAAALTELMPALPRVGSHDYAEVGAADLVPGDAPAAPTRTRSVTRSGTPVQPVRLAASAATCLASEVTAATEQPAVRPHRAAGAPLNLPPGIEPPPGGAAAGRPMARRLRRLGWQAGAALPWGWVCGCAAIGALLGPWIR